MQEVVEHYSHGALEDSILQALDHSGKNLKKLKPQDLSAIDEFHLRGRMATTELAEEIALMPGTKVLDIGCGIGGASRHLASEFGCFVQGIDLTEEYCSVARSLTALTDLEKQISYFHGDALDLPFEDNSFDVVWTQHASMNISDKGQMLKEAYRVLKPGGYMALYDILSNSEKELHYPVPWAMSAAQSFLVTGGKLHTLLEHAGFRLHSWKDCSGQALEWFEGVLMRIQEEGRPQLGYHLLLGDRFSEMAANQLKNLKENRIMVVQAVALRPSSS
ncbi:class I SAM-dependent methyltransferase [Endozoicomonas arenosclerae]|uniref:class I SAM-dependent methyltransferase n=1 Tax=Endozoicomonas arenosclerae TaxID=1633495 RepID=UPI00078462C3|nr:methyltransferase domain-containing protein [Endozoicomonas arenosclerae]